MWERAAIFILSKKVVYTWQENLHTWELLWSDKHEKCFHVRFMRPGFAIETQRLPLHGYEKM